MGIGRCDLGDSTCSSQWQPHVLATSTGSHLTSRILAGMSHQSEHSIEANGELDMEEKRLSRAVDELPVAVDGSSVGASRHENLNQSRGRRHELNERKKNKVEAMGVIRREQCNLPGST